MTVKHTVLYQEHLKLNAKMLPFAGFDMPIQYSGIKAEVEAVRHSAGVFDVSHMGEFWVQGPDSQKYIDYMISNDFLKSKIGKAVYSPLCRENGTVIDDLIAYKLDQETSMICVNAANIQKDWNWFQSHTNDFKVNLTNKSDQFALIALQGPNSENILKEIGIGSKSINLDYYGVIQTSFDNQSLIIARTGYTGEDGFEIFCSPTYAQSLWQLLLEHKATPCGLGARDVLRVEVCYPLYGHELTDELTPLDAALKWAVKCDKSFIGQSALKEATSNYRLVKLSLDKGIPREGYVILNDLDQEIGKITSGTMSPTLGKGIGIGLINRSLWPANKEFKIKIRNNIMKANYTKGAFINGGHK